MNVALWIAQALLTGAFLFSGIFKLRPYDKYAAFVTNKLGSTPAPRELARFIGIVEILGAIGVVLPVALSVAPALTPLAAAGLAIIMLLATGYHLRSHDSTTAQMVLFLLAASVALGRFYLIA